MRNLNMARMDLHRLFLAIILVGMFLNALAIDYYELGTNAYFKREYDQAIDYFEKDIKIKKHSADLNGIATSYNNIGMAYIKKTTVR